MIYLEGSTDLSILRDLARTLGHPVLKVLDDAFVHYVGNQPNVAVHHYYGLREAKSDLAAGAVFDRLEKGFPPGFAIPSKQWKQREIENYLCSRPILMRYAEGMEPDDLVGRARREERKEAMNAAINRVEAALRKLGHDPWPPDYKVSDEFLPNIFKRYFEQLGTDDRLSKSSFHVLAGYIQRNEIDTEVVDVLDLINEQAANVTPI